MPWNGSYPEAPEMSYAFHKVRHRPPTPYPRHEQGRSSVRGINIQFGAMPQRHRVLETPARNLTPVQDRQLSPYHPRLGTTDSPAARFPEKPSPERSENSTQATIIHQIPVVAPRIPKGQMQPSAAEHPPSPFGGPSAGLPTHPDTRQRVAGEALAGPAAATRPRGPPRPLPGTNELDSEIQAPPNIPVPSAGGGSGLVCRFLLGSPTLLVRLRLPPDRSRAPVPPYPV
jgi:hypothetical protein